MRPLIALVSALCLAMPAYGVEHHPDLDNGVIGERFDRTYADATEHFTSVLRFFIDNGNGTQSTCNAVYVVKGGRPLVIVPAHCLYKDGKPAYQSLTQFSLIHQEGIDRPLPLRIPVNRVWCASNGTVSYHDECVLSIDNLFKLKPYAYRHLTLEEIAQFIRTRQDFLLVGFHAARDQNEFLTDQQHSRRYDASMTRSVQKCQLVYGDPPNTIYTDTPLVANCDVLAGTSGSPLMYYDPKIKNYVVIGVVSGSAHRELDMSSVRNGRAYTTLHSIFAAAPLSSYKKQQQQNQ